MNNDILQLSIEEIEQHLSADSLSEQQHTELKKVASENSDIAELMYQFYLNSKDYRNAMYYLEQADKFDDSYAQLCLASLYQQGKHCSQDLLRAKGLFEKSARNGDAEAQFEIGSLLLLSAENEDDIEQGTYWLNESFLNGNDDSKMLLEAV
ncbi:tetratricopeptide repeat protein [Photobacterium sp. TY1-4]|uniref:tetratricopeptide repeat protein n=1 Tax=Photobacterium sp. TY1-4 TaxID=2899122 RepID=UPI0021C1C6D5|nr:sel1 repeat family protein [Photobacterium sp. TY1-4]UXI03246.1 sel1 repeat family protein [Photobacterium sp. TY1-4]